MLNLFSEKFVLWKQVMINKRLNLHCAEPEFFLLQKSSVGYQEKVLHNMSQE